MPGTVPQVALLIRHQTNSIRGLQVFLWSAKNRLETKKENSLEIMIKRKNLNEYMFYYVYET